MHGAPHYTPHQIVEAGQRAEADGQLQYAVQFYRHLLDNFAGSPEAGFAYERLTLLESASQPAPAYDPQVSPESWTPAQGEPSPAPRPEPRPAPRPAQGRGPRPARGDANVAVDTQISMPAIARQRGAVIQNNAGTGAHAVANTRDGYRLGRLVAKLITLAGWLSFLCGGAAAAAAVVVQLGIMPAGSFGVVAIVMPFGGTAAATGFAMIFFGQFARASFDTANATRELVAIARMKSGSQGNQQRH